MAVSKSRVRLILQNMDLVGSPSKSIENGKKWATVEKNSPEENVYDFSIQLGSEKMAYVLKNGRDWMDIDIDDAVEMIVDHLM